MTYEATPAHFAHQLTKRELDVLKLIAGGCTTKEAALVLNISPGTVATHRSSICKKLHVKTTAALVREAMLLGLIQ